MLNISLLLADIVLINISFYTAYLIRFNGIIEMPAFSPYLKLWPRLSLAHLLIFYLCKLCQGLPKQSRKELFLNVVIASAIGALSSISIVYVTRDAFGFIPSSVFVFAFLFNILLLCGWRMLVLR